MDALWVRLPALTQIVRRAEPDYATPKNHRVVAQLGARRIEAHTDSQGFARGKREHGLTDQTPRGYHRTAHSVLIPSTHPERNGFPWRVAVFLALSGYTFPFAQKRSYEQHFPFALGRVCPYGHTETSVCQGLAAPNSSHHSTRAGLINLNKYRAEPAIANLPI